MTEILASLHRLSLCFRPYNTCARRRDDFTHSKKDNDLIYSINMKINIYIYMCVCMCVCMFKILIKFLNLLLN